MNVDPIGPDLDVFDQSGKEGTMACCGQLGPAPADFLGSGDQLALGFMPSFFTMESRSATIGGVSRLRPARAFSR